MVCADVTSDGAACAVHHPTWSALGEDSADAADVVPRGPIVHDAEGGRRRRRRPGGRAARCSSTPCRAVRWCASARGTDYRSRSPLPRAAAAAAGREGHTRERASTRARRISKVEESRVRENGSGAESPFRKGAARSRGRTRGKHVRFFRAPHGCGRDIPFPVWRPRANPPLR